MALEFVLVCHSLLACVLVGCWLWYKRNVKQVVWSAITHNNLDPVTLQTFVAKYGINATHDGHSALAHAIHCGSTRSILMLWQMGAEVIWSQEHFALRPLEILYVNEQLQRLINHVADVLSGHVPLDVARLIDLYWRGELKFLSRA
jgi:hypothetical protein